VLPLTLLVVLASSTIGGHDFCVIVTLCRLPPIGIGDERARLVATSPVMTKSWGQSWWWGWGGWGGLLG
jgi:hypothetical protein